MRRPHDSSVPGEALWRRLLLPPGWQRACGTVTLAVLTVVAGCGESEPAEPAEPETAVTRSEFIEIMVGLREAAYEVQLLDSADLRFAERRDSILATYETTEEELRSFLDAHPELEYQKELWDSITRRLKRPTVRPETRGQGAPIPR